MNQAVKQKEKFWNKFSLKTNERALLDLKIHHYDESNIDEFIWPNDEESLYAKSFLMPFIKKGTAHYIENIDAKVCLLSIGSYILPLTIIDEKYENSYVCSPYGHYISYALASSKNLFQKDLMKKITTGFVGKLGQILRSCNVNKIIYVNNWLFPTDLYSKELKDEHIPSITHFLKRRYPDYAIAFRSINEVTGGSLKSALKKQSYKFIASRQIFLTDPKKEEIFKTRIFKSDLKLLRESSYEIVDMNRLNPEDLPQILLLYKKLYIDKYSGLNPVLNDNYINLLFKEGLLQFKVIKKDGHIEGVFGYFCRGGVMTAPFFGYEKESPEHKNLYRILSTLITLEAKQKGLLLHQSGGASFYKKLRRAESHMEYLAVHCRHLPFKRRIPWNILKWIMNHFAAPFMKKY